MKKSEYITILQLAKILGLSTIAVYEQVEKGQISAIKIGGTFFIPQRDIADILGETLPEEDKKEIDLAIKKTVAEYGQVLKLLGRE